MDDPFALGLAAYRRADYFAAHEHWEALWRAAGDPAERALLRGLIQLAAALHKLVHQGGTVGALRVLDRAAANLGAASPGARGLDVPRLIADLTRLRAEIVRLAADGRSDLAPAWVPRLGAE